MRSADSKPLAFLKRPENRRIFLLVCAGVLGAEATVLGLSLAFSPAGSAFPGVLRVGGLGLAAGLLFSLLIAAILARRHPKEDQTQRLLDFTDSSTDWFWEMDKDLRFSYFSDRFTKVTGVPQEMLLGKTRQESGIPDIDPAAWEAHLDDLANHRSFRDFQHPRTGEDGRTVQLSISGKAIFDEKGSFLGYRGTGRDITHEVAAQKHLKDNQAALAKAQSLARVGNWHWSLEDDRLISCSEEFARIHGVSPDEIHDLMAAQMEKVIHPDDRERVMAAFELFDIGGRDYEIEYRIIRADGAIRDILEIGEVIKDDHGRPQEQAGTLQDITERKRIEEELRKARDELEIRVEERTHELRLREAALVHAKDQAELANRAKTEFLANMSHELRTPLNAVIGFAEVLKSEITEGADLPPLKEYVEDIHQAGLHLLSLINDILDLSVIESGNAKPNPEEVDVPSMISACLRLIEPRAWEKKLELITDLPPGPLPPLHADIRMLKQILINLLSNAVKFTPDEGRIEVKTWQSLGGSLMIRVSDSGIGMAPEDIPKALARFGQVDGRLNRSHQGSGLGLPLSVAMVELHGGSFRLRSKPDKGTTIWMRFPLEAESAAAPDRQQRIAG